MATVDKITYSLWLEKEWDKLIIEGKKSLDHGIDFYYLRVRMGIAYFEKQNYHQSIRHFEKAYAVNSVETFLKEYLYYSYLYSGRQTEAEILAATFSWQLKEKIGIKENNLIDQLDFTYNSGFIANPSVTNKYSINIDSQKNGAQYISKGHHYFNLSLKHSLNPKISIFHAYSYIAKTSFVYSQQGGIFSSNPDYKTSLHQYYLSGNARLAKGLNMLLGLHYINIRYPVEVTDFRQGQNRITTQTFSENDIVSFVSIYRNFSYFTLGASFYYAGLNNARQIQGDFLLTLYPLGNLNLYTVSTVSYQSETNSGDRSQNRLIFDQLMGFKLTSRIWIEGYGSLGDMHNFLRNDGFVVYNGTDIIKRRYGGRLILPLKPAFKIRFDYSMLAYESSFIPALPDHNIYNTIQYTNHSITGGIIWNY
ncbi:hypothetical protein F9K33_09340 [bacterium]|nr:MAG: hypothetical protein F9K33_09340 [bacterium]